MLAIPLVVALCSFLSMPVQAKYTAAFSSLATSSSSPSSVNETLALYARDFALADQAGADFLLFPEFSLFSPQSREQTRALCSPVHTAAMIASIQRELQQTNLTFAMVNYCETVACNGTCPFDDHVQVFNTNFVIDRVRGVVATYHKSHVYMKKIFDQPSMPDLVVVDTYSNSLGAKFGLFMCFDILFPSPGPALRKQGVTHFLYNAAIPIVGDTVFAVWSYTQKATLLAADHDNQGGAFVQGKQMAKSYEKAIKIAHSLD